MERRCGKEWEDGPLVAGLMLAALGLTAIAWALTDPTSLFGLPPVLQVSKPSTPVHRALLAATEPCSCLRADLEAVTHGTGAADSAQPPRALLASSSESGKVGDDGDAETDARAYLLEAAAAGRQMGPGSPRASTQTILWINAPASIGSSSPAEASPSLQQDASNVADMPSGADGTRHPSTPRPGPDDAVFSALPRNS